MRKMVSVISILLIFITVSFRGENDLIVYQDGLQIKGIAIDVSRIGQIHAGKLVVADTVDLKGRICELPEGILLDVSKGQIRNGELVGHNNKLKCREGAFYRVRISGEWIVPTIKSSFFSDISYDNAICDIIALSNAKINNRIIIDEGDYQVTIKHPWHGCINLNSNTELNLNGTIILTPNSHPGCYIINVKGDNVKIKGCGRIIGDRESHTAKSGEWGMGVNIDKANNVSVSGITVESCWGDCIYIGKAERVIIQKCTLKNSRRQGISITAANDVKIKKCKISGIKGTRPEFGIDIEPNINDTCSNIRIEQVEICDCQGGIFSWGGAKGATVNTIKVRNCRLERIHKSPFRFDDVDNVSVERCHVIRSGKKNPFTLINTRNFTKRNVSIE